MIPHHQQAIEMAQMALDEPTSSARVKALATSIKGAQDPEIQMMNGWLEAWGMPMHTPSGHGMTMGEGMMTDADMSDLMKQRGVAFDDMWTTMMIAHHQGAISMANDALVTSTNADVLALARAVISGQEQEVAKMRRWI